MLRSALVLLGAGFLLASCSPSEPKKAKDETEHKLHDDPAIVRFRFTKATLKDLSKWAEQPTLADIEPTTEQQEMSLSLTRDGFLAHKDKGVEEFKVESTTSSPSTVYLLEVFYTDAQGRPMNHQFIDNGQDRIHQHFFRRYTERELGGKARIYPINKLEELGYDYRYADITPWDKPYTSPESRFTGVSNPMGFKGLIRFTEADLRFHLTILLMHAHEPKYRIDPKTQRSLFMPFYNNDAFAISQEADISIDVPITVDKGSKDERLAKYRK